MKHVNIQSFITFIPTHLPTGYVQYSTEHSTSGNVPFFYIRNLENHGGQEFLDRRFATKHTFFLRE